MMLNVIFKKKGREEMITLTIIILAIVGLALATGLMVAAGVAAALISCADVLVAAAIIYLIVRFVQKRI